MDRQESVCFQPSCESAVWNSSEAQQYGRPQCVHRRPPLARRLWARVQSLIWRAFRGLIQTEGDKRG